MAFSLEIPEELLNLGEEAQPHVTSTPKTQQHGEQRRGTTNLHYTRSRVGTSQQYTPGQLYTPPPDPVVNSHYYYRRKLVPPPLKYCLESGHNFEQFLNDFETYCDNTYPDVVDTWSRVLGQYLEGNMLDSFNNIDGGRLPYYLVKEKLRKIVQQASRNKDKMIEKYWTAKREKEETIINFSMRLDRLAELAGIDIRQDLFKEMKKIKILDGLSGESAAKVKFAALSEPGIDIDRIIELADNIEMCFIGDKEDRKTEIKETTTEKIENKKEVQVSVTDKKSEKTCNFCKKEGHLETECYKKNNSCFCCGKTGHRIKDCRKRIAQERNKEHSNNNSDRREQQEQREQTTRTQRLQCPYCRENHLMKNCEEFKNALRRTSRPLTEQGGIKGVRESLAPKEVDRRLYLDVNVKGAKIRALVDTGAQMNVINYEIAQLLQEEIQNTNIQIVGVHGDVERTEGERKLSFRLENYQIKKEPFIISSKITHEMILGIEFLKKHFLEIDFENNRLVCRQDNNNEIIVCNFRFNSVPISNVRLNLKKNVHIKPGHIHKVELLWPKHIENPYLYSTEVQGLEKFQNSGLFISNTVNNGETAFVNIINLGDETYKINKNDLEILTIELIKDGKTLQEIGELNNENSEKEQQQISLKDRFNLDQTDLTEEQKDLVCNTLENFLDIISKDDNDVGYTTKMEHRIKLNDYTPIRQKVRRFNPKVQELMDEELKVLEQQGIIQPSKSPWSSPIVPIVKKNGKIRVCIDYRALNQRTIKDSFPLPSVNDCIYNLKGSSYFSLLDMTKGYYNLPMEEKSKEYTAFTTSSKHLEFVRLPFGLCNSPATFQRLVNLMIQDFTKTQVMAYLDDILILGRNFEEHLENLNQVLEKLREFNLKIKPEKCNIFRRKVKFLGQEVSEEGLLPLTENIEAIQKAPVPKTVKQVQSFLGSVNYYRRHIPDAAKLMKPLSQLTTGKSIKWTQECQESFERLKEALINPPILAFPDYESKKPLELYVDASGTGAGACLKQWQEGEQKIIAYASMCFGTAQRNYSTLEKELAALRWGVKVFRTFLMCRRFVIWSDHQPLTYLHNMAGVNARIARTLTDLSEYNFDIKYLPGKFNHISDFLSRCVPENIEEVEIEEDIIPVGFREKEVKGGGNSLFIAVALFLFHDEKAHKIVRERAVNEVRNNLKTYGLIDNKQTRQNLNRMNISGTLVSSEIVEACARIYNIHIKVYHNKEQAISYNAEGARICYLLSVHGIHFNLLEEIRPELAFGEQVTEVNLIDLNCEDKNLVKEIVLFEIDIEEESDEDSEKEIDDLEELTSLNTTVESVIDPEEIKDLPSRKVPLKYNRNEEKLTEEIRKGQIEDTNLQDLKRILQENNTVQQQVEELKRTKYLNRYIRFLRNIIEKDGILYYKENGKDVPLIGYNDLKDLIIDYHKTQYHPGRDKIIKKIQEITWSPNIRNLCEQVTRVCIKCQQRKLLPARQQRPPTWKVQARKPFDVVAIDLMEMPKTKLGQKYIFVAVDMYSKWTSAVAIPDKTATTVLKAFKNMIATFLKDPLEIQSDNGKEFTNHLFEEFLKTKEIKHRCTVANMPQTNGLVERVNQTLLNMFRMIDNLEEWDEHLPDVVAVYNHTYHREIGKTPANIFLNNVERNQVNDKTWGKRQQNYEPYKLNELVLKKNILKGHNVENKLAKKYHGPYKIVKTYENGVMYDLQHKYRNTLLLRIHHKHLKKWYDTPEELKEVNPKQNSEDNKSETSENDFEGFAKEYQSMFKVNWEKVTKYNIQLNHDRDTSNETSQESERSNSFNTNEPSVVSQYHATYNMEPWIQDELQAIRSEEPIIVTSYNTKYNPSRIWRELMELEEIKTDIGQEVSFNFSGFES